MGVYTDHVKCRNQYPALLQNFHTKVLQSLSLKWASAFKVLNLHLASYEQKCSIAYPCKPKQINHATSFELTPFGRGSIYPLDSMNGLFLSELFYMTMKRGLITTAQ